MQVIDNSFDNKELAPASTNYIFVGVSFLYDAQSDSA